MISQNHMGFFNHSFSIKIRWILSLAVLVSFFGLFLPPVVTYTYAAEMSYLPGASPADINASFTAGGTGASAAGFGATPEAGSNAACTYYVAGASARQCFTWTFFGTSFASGICTGEGICTATTITPLGAIGMAGITTAINLGVTRAINGAPNTGSSGNPYTSGNPYGQATCTGTKYISPTPTNDPCGVYISGQNPPSSTPGPATATLSATPMSGTAPLSVSFTVTDTSTACSHPAIMISAGDGTPAVVAIPTSTTCTGRTPQVFTGVYRTAGTYQATIISAGTQQVLQTVTVTVRAGNTATTTTPAAGVATATLTAVPTSGNAPLPVTFTVTDTSATCSHPDIMISAGDGTAPAVAIPANSNCAGHLPITFNPYTYRSAGTYQAKILNASTQQVLQQVAITVSSSTATTNDRTSATLTAVPTSGPAPLTVRLTVTDTTTVCPRSEVTLSVLAGTRAITVLPATSVCGGSPPLSFDYVYQTPGTYRAEIANTNTNRVLQSVNIFVGNPVSVPSTNVNNGTGSVNVSSSLLNLTGGTGNNASNATATRPAGTGQPSTSGNIQVTASGVTITAGGHDSDGRTGISGFYGYNAIPGVAPQALAQKLCNERPWATSSATPVIPPSFFDSICTSRGYKAGKAVPTGTGAGTGVGSGTASSPPAPPATSATATTTGRTSGLTVATVPAKVYIMAVPSSVKIGTRTSIFWNAVGVKSCKVTSPDGSFGGNTLSGAASTVALSGETIFSIVCVKPDGSLIANAVKVKISI